MVAISPFPLSCKKNLGLRLRKISSLVFPKKCPGVMKLWSNVKFPELKFSKHAQQKISAVLETEFCTLSLPTPVLLDTHFTQSCVTRERQKWQVNVIVRKANRKPFHCLLYALEQTRTGDPGRIRGVWFYWVFLGALLLSPNTNCSRTESSTP